MGKFPLLTIVLVCALGDRASAVSETFIEEISAVSRLGATDNTATLMLELQSRSELDHELVVTVSMSKGWQVQLESESEFFVPAGEELPVLRFAIRPSEGRQVPEFAVLSVAIRDPRWSAFGFASVHYFRAAGGRLYGTTVEAYAEGLRPLGGDAATLPFEGEITHYPADVVWPIDVPGIDPEEAQALTDFLKAKLASSDAVSVQTSALSSGERVTAAEPSSGCAGGDVDVTTLWVAGVLPLLLFRRKALTGIAAFVVAAGIASPSKAVQHCAWGELVFWDTRTNSQSGNYVSEEHVGWRLEQCNASVGNCIPSMADCCRTAVNGTELVLLRQNYIGGPVTPLSQASVPSGTSGLFSVCDSNWISGYVYTLRINWKSKASPPAFFQIEPASGGVAYNTDIPISLAAVSTPLGVISINSAGDTASTGGDVAHLFRIAWDTLSRLDGDGETRHRKTFSGSGYNLIRIKHPVSLPTGVAGRSTSQSVIEMKAGFSRGYVVAREIGRIWQWRITNANGLVPNPIGMSATALLTSEGITLNEGVGDLIAMAYLFDPQTTLSGDLIPNFMPCVAATSSRANEASNEWNSVYGLWELLDANGGNTFHSKSDSSDVTLKDLMDAQLSLKASTGGANRDIDEGTFTPTMVTCASGCPDGQVCGAPGNNVCVSGDVHAVNVRDWADHLVGTVSTHENTLISSECLGPIDDSSAGGGFTGGFRFD